MSRKPSGGRARAAALVEEADASLLDLVDNALNRGVVIEGDVMLGLADVDLVYLRLSVLLSAVGRLGESESLSARMRSLPGSIDRP